MSTPTHCAACGHELGIGRFCINCGQPVPGRYTEDASLLGAPVVPPPTSDLPPAARFPLYAEPAKPAAVEEQPPAPDDLPPTPAKVTEVAEIELAQAATPAAATEPTPDADTAIREPIAAADLDTPSDTRAAARVDAVPAPAADDSTSVVPAARRRPARSDEAEAAATPKHRGVRGWLPWVVGFVLVILVGALGLILVVGGDDGDTAADRPSDSPGTARTTDDTQGSGRPDSDGTGAPVAAPEEVADLPATATVPAHAPPSTDRQGRRVTFAAANMLDGKPRTAWRMPGDGTGETLTFDLGADVVLTQVGLINGYAKVDGADNWYRGNRRVQVVQWELDDGTRVTQELTDRPTLQELDLEEPVATRTVRLHLVEVSAPGRGASSRDYTAISEVRLRGGVG